MNHRLEAERGTFALPTSYRLEPETGVFTLGLVVYEVDDAEERADEALALALILKLTL